MKFKIPHFIILSSIYLFAAGCKSYIPIPYFVSTTITKPNEEPCLLKSNEVKTFLANEQIKFNYNQVGIVEFFANYEAHDQAKIDYLKYEAWKNCADAIINISSDYNYGVAVKIIKDKKFFSNYHSQTDTSFITYVKMDQEYLQNSNSQNSGYNNGNTPDQTDETASIKPFFLILGIILVPFIISEAGED